MKLFGYDFWLVFVVQLMIAVVLWTLAFKALPKKSPIHHYFLVASLLPLPLLIYLSFHYPNIYNETLLLEKKTLYTKSILIDILLGGFYGIGYYFFKNKTTKPNL